MLADARPFETPQRFLRGGLKPPADPQESLACGVVAFLNWEISGESLSKCRQIVALGRVTVGKADRPGDIPNGFAMI
jgi:hypothetical protein